MIACSLALGGGKGEGQVPISFILPHFLRSIYDHITSDNHNSRLLPVSGKSSHEPCVMTNRYCITKVLFLYFTLLTKYQSSYL